MCVERNTDGSTATFITGFSTKVRRRARIVASSAFVRRLKVLQSKYFRLATGAPWYASNRQIHEDLVVPLFADHVRALTATFDSKLADVWKPLIRQIDSYLR
jgi:hypothetical protein